MSAEVFYKKCKNYDYEKIYEFVEGLIGEKGVYSEILKSGMKVLLKPNMLAPFHEDMCVTTNPLLVSAVADVVRKRGCEVWIGDSPGGDFSKGIDVLWNKTGMYQSIQNISEQVIFERKPIYLSLEDGKVCKKILLSEYCLDADVIINLPKLKTHTFTLLSGGIKNLFGLVPGRIKGLYHKEYPNISEFSDFLIDLAEFIKPELTIIDGIWGMEGHGPGASGTPVNLGILLASTNVLAVDIAMTQYVGIPSEAVPYIKKGIERKAFGISDVTNVIWNGEKVYYDKEIRIDGGIESYISSDKKNTGYRVRHPFLDKTKCTGCKRCIENCPQKTIQFMNGFPEFGNACIDCMCCMEMCLQGAILPEAVTRNIDICK